MAETPTDNIRKYLANLGSALSVSLSTVGGATAVAVDTGADSASPQAALDHNHQGEEKV